MSWLLLNDAPKLLLHEGWYFSSGGDENLYYTIGQSIALGRPPVTSVAMGQPFVMAALVWLTGKLEYRGILPWLVIWQGFILAGLSVWVMAHLSYELTRNRGQALASAFIWTFSAYLLWLILGLHGQAEVLRSAYVARQLWMNGLTDPPSLFLTMLGLLVALKGIRESQQSRRRDTLLLTGGVTLGLAAVFRIQTGAMTGVVLLALLWNRQWRGLALTSIGLVIGFLPQLWYNAAVNGNIFNMPYLSNWIGFDPAGRFYFAGWGIQFSPQFFVENLILITRGSWGVALLEIAVAVAGITLFLNCWQQHGGLVAMIMFGAPLASLGLHAITFVFAIDPIRFALPALSIGVPAGVWSLFFAASTLQTKFVSWRSALGAKGAL
jgi:hypothetical protein